MPLFSRLRDGPLIQRDPPPAPAQTDPVEAQQSETLSAANLELSDEDKQRLLANFPTGFTLTPQQVYLTAAWSGSVNSARVGAFRVVETIPLRAGVESYIFRVGKGRAILVSSVGGPSVMLDVGSSVSGSAVLGLNAVLGAGIANAPDVLKVSHTDKDHINEVGTALRARGMNNTAVEIGLQQFQNAVGQGDWVRANIQLTPAQAHESRIPRDPL
jgi:beta-lactamase superfamily II metal-dependent hydrolase